VDPDVSALDRPSARYLEPAELAQVKALLAPYPSDGMICWPVSPRVGSVKNNDPGLVEPIDLP
jgi:putative SOS response-associated peptidase YedK